MLYPEFLILRHGQTEWNHEGRMQSSFDSPLTNLGRQQAQRQNQLLLDLGVADWHWFSSPQGRAHDTALLAAQGVTENIRPDPRLREIELGEWSGMLRSDIAKQAPHLFETDGLGWYDHAPGGEGLTRLGHRCAAFLSDLTAPSVIVTHGITSRVMRCLAQGMPVEAFDTLGGGQGVIYHIAQGNSQLLD